VRSAWVVWLVCAGLVAAALGLLGANVQVIDNPGIAVGQALTIVALLGFATAGIVIRRHRPQNRMGWVFLGGGTLGALNFAAGEYALRALAPNAGHVPLARDAAWLYTWTDFPAIFGLLVLTLFLFPDGAVGSPCWRVLLILVAAATALVTLAAALAPGPLPDPAWRGVWTNPFGVGGPLGRQFHAVAAWGYPVTAVSLAVGVAALVVRYRRSDLQQRRQLKWLLYALALTVAVFAWFTVVPHRGPMLEGIQGTVNGLAVLAIPVGAGIGVLKHRLYDIDLLISKTFVYGGLVAFIIVVYLLVVVGVGTLTGARGNPGLAVLATAAAAVAFQPVRARLTQLANRLVWGQQAGALELLGRLSQAMAAVDELDQVVSTTARIITTGVGAAHGVVWLRQGSQLIPGAQWPPTGLRLPQSVPVVGDTLAAIEGEGRTWPVRYRGALIGAVSVSMPAGQELAAGQDRQLAQLAWAAGLVLENVRLVAELRASRARILAAQDAERRRLERDLHDGAQQRLVNLSLALGIARAKVTALHAPQLTTVLDAASAQAQQALTELRDLARGIHPAILTDRGLLPAVRSLLEHTPIPAVLSAAPQEPQERLPAAVEATAYFVVAEAVANALKHAAPTRIDVDISCCDERLLVQVGDDGHGGAAFRPHGGLQGLADRVAVLGGQLELDSSPHAGTRLRAVLPCG
jgi:signal transduction histidine kinase